VPWITRPLPRLRPAVFFRLRLRLQNTAELLLASSGKKRRENVRQDCQKFNLYGAAIDYIDSSLPSVLAEEMYQCLLMSTQHNDLTVPFEDLLNHKHAFFSQDQYFLVERAGNRVIGFFSYFPNRGEIQQCHGGFDYDFFLKTKAYHNLMHAVVELAIHNGYDRVALGPLNNETSDWDTSDADDSTSLVPGTKRAVYFAPVVHLEFSDISRPSCGTLALTLWFIVSVFRDRHSVSSGTCR